MHATRCSAVGTTQSNPWSNPAKYLTSRDESRKQLLVAPVAPLFRATWTKNEADHVAFERKGGRNLVAPIGQGGNS